MKVLLGVFFCIQACFAASIGLGASCPAFCTEQYSPVCGTDGKTYSNNCFLGIATCHNSAIGLAHQGQCSGSSTGTGIGSGSLLCQNMMCITLWDPVCGSDGNTYSNQCTLNSKNCGKSTPVSIAHRGACGGGPSIG